MALGERDGGPWGSLRRTSVGAATVITVCTMRRGVLSLAPEFLPETPRRVVARVGFADPS